MSDVGGTLGGGGWHPSDSSRVGGKRKAHAVDGQTANEKVLKAINLNPRRGRRVIMEATGLKEWKLRKVARDLEIWGWVRRDHDSGWIVTHEGEKILKKAVGGTLQGSPLVGPEGYAVRVPDPHRLHGGRIVAEVDRSLDPEKLLGFVRETLTGVHKIPTAYLKVWMDNGNGRLPIPVQIFKAKDQTKPYTLTIQSLNAIHSHLVVGSMDRDVTLTVLMDEMNDLMKSWLGDQYDLLGPLEWKLHNMDVEDAVPVPVNPATIGGNPQRDGVAEDGTSGAGQGSKGTPWKQEQETTLTWKDRIIASEKAVAMLEDGQNRILALQERIALASAEQLDGVMAALEQISKGRGL